MDKNMGENLQQAAKLMAQALIDQEWKSFLKATKEEHEDPDKFSNKELFYAGLFGGIVTGLRASVTKASGADLIDTGDVDPSLN